MSSISPALSVPSTSDPSAKVDVRARALMGQIQDWANCPTTDPGTKKEIVGKLSSELADVYKEIGAQDAKVNQGQPSPSSLSGLGSNLDLSV